MMSAALRGHGRDGRMQRRENEAENQQQQRQVQYLADPFQEFARSARRIP